LCIRVASHDLLCDGDSRVNVSASSAGGDQYAHYFQSGTDFSLRLA